MSKKRLVEMESLMTEWDYEKNSSVHLYPENLTTGTAKKAFWICSKCGNRWQASIAHRAADYRPTGCPKCSANFRAKKRQSNLQAKSNIAKLYPFLLSEWDYEKNTILPTAITKGSHLKIWWKCKSNHRWQAPVGNRIKGHGCPFCSGRNVIPGENDLETMNPTLAKEWNYEKNGGEKPCDVKYGSPRKVWWKCKYGHEWEASITNRQKKRGCPICSKYKRSSLPEKAIVYYLSKWFTVEQNKKIPKTNMELDLFLPELNLGIEYDGSTWHSDINRDRKKDLCCQKNGILLIRVREKGCPQYESTAKIISTESPDSDLTFLTSAIEEILFYIAETYKVNVNICVDISKDFYKILALVEKYDDETSLAIKYPDLLKEWNYNRNGNLRPDSLAAGSSRRVWWICSKGHEWCTSIANRTNISNKNQCPYCQRKKTIIGENDIVTRNCSFLADWDYVKNPISPNHYMKNSGKVVWWKCSKCGFEWQATIDSRSKHGCRYCSRKESWKLRTKKVKNVDTGDVFDSAQEASLKYGIRPASILRVCNKKRKMTGGYHWEYFQ